MFDVTGGEIEKRYTALAFARLLRTYLELATPHQKVLRELASLVADASADADDRERALDAMTDALFPRPTPAPGGSGDGGRAAAAAECDREEETFAARLRALMAEKRVTQSRLAAKIGVQQSAVSMMLNRRCRPQRETVVKIARALKVLPEELWPETPPKRRRAV